MMSISLIINIIYNIVHVYTGIILLYCILSWFPNSRGYGTIGKIYRFLGKIVDPYLNIFRRIIPPIGGTMDISPIIAMIVLEAIVSLLVKFLMNIIV